MIVVQRMGLAVLAALTVALAAGFTVHALYNAGYMAVDVSDGEGHGPDEGSAEWRDAVQRAIPRRAAKAGALAGTVCFFVLFRALRPRGNPPASADHPADGTRSNGVFTFQPRWKEELVCSCSRGSFVLEMPMGIATVYLPTAERWPAVAPAWAKEDWTVVHRELAAWCRRERIPLRVDATAQVTLPHGGN